MLDLNRALDDNSDCQPPFDQVGVDVSMAVFHGWSTRATTHSQKGMLFLVISLGCENLLCVVYDCDG